MQDKQRTSSDKEILKTRAELLARPKQATGKQDTISVVSFLLRDEIYAIEIRFVSRVLPFEPPTFIPGLPEFIAGIINVRGEILSVVDLKVLFELEVSAGNGTHHILILSRPEMEFGILADQVLGVRKIAAHTLQSSPSPLKGARGEYIKRVDEGGLIVLDGEKLLTDTRLTVEHGIE